MIVDAFTHTYPHLAQFPKNTCANAQMVPTAPTSELRLAANSSFPQSRDRALHTDSLAVPERDVAQCSETERCVCRSKIGNQPASFGVPHGRDITVQAESSSEARRIVMEMIPGAVVTAVKRRVK
jgi:hypothetical protein